MRKICNSYRECSNYVESEPWLCEECKNKLNRFHDAILDSTTFHLSTANLVKAFKYLPEEIKEIAESWGYNDTLFGDKVYLFFETPENKKLLEILSKNE